jgi:hypothetical protein
VGAYIKAMIPLKALILVWTMIVTILIIREVMIKELNSNLKRYWRFNEEHGNMNDSISMWMITWGSTSLELWEVPSHDESWKI